MNIVKACAPSLHSHNSTVSSVKSTFTQIQPTNTQARQSHGIMRKKNCRFFKCRAAGRACWLDAFVVVWCLCWFVFYSLLKKWATKITTATKEGDLVLFRSRDVVGHALETEIPRDVAVFLRQLIRAMAMRVPQHNVSHNLVKYPCSTLLFECDWVIVYVDYWFSQLWKGG